MVLKITPITIYLENFFCIIDLSSPNFSNSAFCEKTRMRIMGYVTE